jgi:integrase
MDAPIEFSAVIKHKAKDRDGLYRRRQYWHYELNIEGKKRSFTTGTKDYNQAKKIRAEAVRNLQHGKPPNDSGRKHFESAAAEYINHREATVSAGTVRLEKERLRSLKRILGNVTLKEILPRTIKDYQTMRAAEVSNKTVNLEIDLLRGILKHEGQWDRLESDYKRLRKSGERPGRSLSSDESLRLFTAAESNANWLVAYLAAVVANDTGMRSVELRHLRLKDLSSDGRKITVNRSKTDGGIRTIILTNDAVKAMIRLQDRAQKLGSTLPEDFVFPYKIRNGTGYDPSKPMKGWRTAWRKLTRSAGLPGFRFHDLRHTFITNHAEIGTPIQVLMATAGHLSHKMTELYTHISHRSMQEAAERYEQRKAELLAEARAKVVLDNQRQCTSQELN